MRVFPVTFRTIRSVTFLILQVGKFPFFSHCQFTAFRFEVIRVVSIVTMTMAPGFLQSRLRILYRCRGIKKPVSQAQ